MNLYSQVVKVARRDFRDRRGELKDRRDELINQRGQFKNRRGASFLKSWACSETTGQSSFPDLSALVTCNLCTRRSSELEEASSEIEEASAFPDVLASVTCTLSFVEITGSLSKRRFQISKRHLLFQTCQRLSHAHSALRKSRVVCRSADSRYRRGICFSKRVSACHMHTQPCENYGQSVEDFL
ncbi:hypothetical protein ACFX11_003692 [Malus domestica]